MKKLTAISLVFILVATILAGCRSPMDSGATENSGEDSTPTTATNSTDDSKSTLPTNATANTENTLTTPTDDSSQR